jgi:LacI family transcriptional regulator
MAAPGGPPDAVFIASDTMASGALQALRDAGLKSPDHVAIFGFDGLEEIQVSQPILSTVVQPISDLGRQAVRTLLELLSDPAKGTIQRFLPTRLSIRRSCGCNGTPVASLAGMRTGGAAV